MWGEIAYPTPAMLPNSSEKLGNNESAIRVLTDNSGCDMAKHDIYKSTRWALNSSSPTMCRNFYCQNYYINLILLSHIC